MRADVVAYTLVVVYEATHADTCGARLRQRGRPVISSLLLGMWWGTRQGRRCPPYFPPEATLMFSTLELVEPVLRPRTALYCGDESTRE